MLDFRQAAPAEKAKNRAIVSQRQNILRPQGRLGIDGRTVNRYGLYAGQVLYLVLIVIKKDLCVSGRNRGVVEHEITACVCADGDGKLIK